jgi:hypothetical protein
MKVNNYAVKTPEAGDKLFGSDSNGDQAQFDMSNFGTTIYKVYAALLTQRTSGAPTSDILENTIGNIVFTKDVEGPGVYYAILTGAFVNNKTWIVINQPPGKARAEVYRDNADTLVINTYNSSGILSDGILTDCALEIRVYN